MSDKTAADALVAALRQKRKQRQDSLQASVRKATPLPSDDDRLRDDGDDNNDGETKGDNRESKTEPSTREIDAENDDEEENRGIPSLADLREEEDEEEEEEDDNKTKSPPSSSAPPPPPPTESLSKTMIRERMRQKMLARREQPAATSDGEASEREGSKSLSMTSRRLRGLREAKTLMAKTRFDVAESNNEDDLEQEVAARTLQMRDRWKRAVSSAEDPSLRRQGPTEEEAFDFFTGMWKADEEKEVEDVEVDKTSSPEQPDVIEEKEEEEGDNDEEQEEDTKMLISDFFPDDDEPLDFVHFVEADYMRRWEREALLSQPLYVPGGAILTAEEKLRGVIGESPEETAVKSDVEENDEAFRLRQRLPRDWESEGFYVGAPPFVTLSNRNKMEYRLLTEPHGAGRKWFRADGKLDAAPLPLKTVATRPPIDVEDISEDIETRFVDPVVDNAASLTFFSNDAETGHLGALAAHQRHLQIDLRNLSFTHHHLFSEEHVVALRLEQLYDQYVEHRKKDAIALKTLKIDTLRRSIETMKDKLETLTRSRNAATAAAGEENEVEETPEMATTMTRLTSRLRAHRTELKQLVQLRDLDMKHAKALTNGILSKWKALKTAREKRGFSLTGGKLGIIKEEADEEQDKAWWEKELAAAVEMKREEFNDERAEKMKAYEKELEAWRLARKVVKEAQKKERQKKKKKKAKSPGDDEAEGILSEEEDLSVASAVDLETAAAPKPQKPPVFDEDAAIATAIEFGRLHWRKPGDPIIRFEWTPNGHPITAENETTYLEQKRREAVGSTKISVRILFNGKEVVKTPPKSLTNEFVVSINASFQLRVNPSAYDDLRLEIYESTSFVSSTLLAEVFAPIPDAASPSAVEETLQFSCGRVFLPKTGVGVGSGAPFTPSYSVLDETVETMTSPLTTGKIDVGVFWTQKEDAITVRISPSTTTIGSSPFIRGANASMTMLKRGDVLGATGIAGISDKTKLKNWISQDANLDPNDPKNADFVQLLEDEESEAVADGHLAPVGRMEKKANKDYFRLNHAHQEFDFCTEEELNADPRFRLLEMRSQKIPEFRNLKMIPAFGSEIPASIFTPYEDRIKAEQLVDQGGEGEEEDETDVDAKRRRMIRFLQKVRKQVADRFQQVSKYKTVKDVVIEEEIPNVSTLAASIYSLQARFARPLHPVRIPRKPNVQGSNVPGAPGGIGPDVAVYVNILRAFNLPTREVAEVSQLPAPTRPGYGGANPFVVSSAAARFQRGMGGGGMGGGDRFSPSPPPGRSPEDDLSAEGSPLMRPFVEVMFQRRTARTSTSEGSNASWNEELLLPFIPPNDDFSPAALRKVDDVIHVTLFDEVVTDISEAEEETATTKIIRQSVVNKWLGCIKIPFTTLFFNGKIEGTFRVNVPSVLLGYRKSKEGFLQDQFRSTGNHSYLHFYLTLDPSLAPADPIRERFDSSESEQLLTKADEFMVNFAKRFPDRSEVTMTVINLQGKSVFVTRFVRPLTPPSELMVGPNWQTASSAARVARFVACIPNVSDSAFFAGMCDLWSTCDQFLQMMTGDEEEHAVLLVNFFLAMGKPAWLVLGIAIPEGPTAYVLTKDGLAGDWWLWNPSSGIRYSVKDSFCPMTSIHSLINDQNVWLNVQNHVQPAQMNFDLNNARDWNAFYGGKFLNPGMSSVQPEALHYASIDETYVRSLTEKLERSVRENLMRWRPKQITRWNRLCSQALEKVLPRLEEAAGMVGGDAESDHPTIMEPLTPFLSSYSLTGFPLHSAFTENAAILDAVYATGIHNNSSPDVEFALGVYIHAYPAHVLSVWVYVASLEKKSD